MAKGIFSRMADIVKANINDLLNCAEEPEKMIRQMILEMEEAVNKATTSLGMAVTNEKRLERQYLNEQDQSESWQKKAELAVKAREDDLARRALERKSTVQETIVNLEQALDESRKTSEQLKQQLQQLKTKLDEARTRQGALIARRRAAEAQKQITKGTSGIGDDAFSSFEHFCNRIATEEAEADAHQEIVGSGPDLENKLNKLERKQVVNEELKALKKKMGKDNT